MILAGDIGGTKTNLALITFNNQKIQTIFSKQFSSQNYKSFYEILDEFLSLHKNQKISVACFGIAGPIVEGNSNLTNLSWNINTIDLQNKLNTSKVKLLNDLEATAYGMLYLNDEELIELNPNAKKQKGNIAVIAAGTGLGEAILYNDGINYYPIGTEGGHTDFAPLTQQQNKLLEWLKTKYPEHVSYERVLSGQGITTLYQFLLETNFAPECKQMLNISNDEDKNAMISKCAFELNDKLSLETLKLFIEIYGAEAGNLALKSMSIGGVFIGGGIAPKILHFIQNGIFINSFLKKGRFEKLLKNISIKVSLNEQTALLGSARYAYDKLV